MTPEYKNRTPELIKADHAEYNDIGARQLERFLTEWMTNDLNARDFAHINSQKDLEPSERCKLMFMHALDWLQYGN